MVLTPLREVLYGRFLLLTVTTSCIFTVAIAAAMRPDLVPALGAMDIKTALLALLARWDLTKAMGMAVAAVARRESCWITIANMCRLPVAVVPGDLVQVIRLAEAEARVEKAAALTEAQQRDQTIHHTMLDL